MQRFFKSIDFIEQHLYDKISVHEVAAASHYSTYHFSRIFKALVGDTPKEYLRKRRLTVAAKRLLGEDIGILELALECQFDSQEAFTRAFKGLFNITPAPVPQTKRSFQIAVQRPVQPAYTALSAKRAFHGAGNYYPPGHEAGGHSAAIRQRRF
ncbi:helix-turn-helix transcriptional regulator [Thalassomonas viridans]|uniref:helix-turn-helix transcriptional regulator n=1 Tax=Thalassomonas viridans TaxID=137584 RepID=UPI00191C586D|nr:AraC family transcriptional regulator [Thalassomonas viridans]